MPNLFGLDIAKLVADGIAQAGNLRPGTLTHVVGPGARDPNNPNAGRQPVTTTHSFQGFVEVRAVRRDDTLIAEPRPILTILGATLNPPIDFPAGPDVDLGDKATIDGMTYTLVRLIERDPAGATYVFEVR